MTPHESGGAARLSPALQCAALRCGAEALSVLIKAQADNAARARFTRLPRAGRQSFSSVFGQRGITGQSLTLATVMSSVL